MPQDTPTEDRGFDAGNRRALISMLEDQKLTAEALRESERRISTLMANLPGMAYRCPNKPGWPVAFVSEGSLSLTGYSPEELGGDGPPIYGDLIHPDDRRMVGDGVEDAMRAATSFLLEYRIRNKQGEVRWVREQGRAVGTDADGFAILEGFVADITERKIAERALRESEQRYRSLFENMAQGCFYQKSDGTLIDCNPALLEIFGLTRDQFLGRTSMHPEWKVVCEDGSELPGEEHPSMRALRSGNPVRNAEVGVFNPQKKAIVWVNVNAIPDFHEGESTPYQVFVTAHDITEKRRIGQQVQESEARFRSLMQQSPFVVELYDIGGLQISVNRAYEELWGFPAETTLNTFNVLKSKEVEASGLMAYIRRAYAGESVDVPEYRFDPTGDTEAKGKGRIRWLSTRIYPIKDESGRVQHIVIVHMDISDRKRSEQALQRSETRFRTMAKHAPMGVYMTDAEGQCTFVNDVWCEAAGLSPAEAMGSGWTTALHPDDLDQIGQTWNDMVQTNGTWHHHYRFRNPNGRVTWIEGYAAPMLNPDGDVLGYVGMNVDTTERRRTEAELAHHREHLEEEIREQTRDLRTMVDAMAGREVRMAELKDEIAALREQLSAAGVDSGGGTDETA